MRQNILTDRWVVYAPDRVKRPQAVGCGTHRAQPLPEHDAGWPFCVGNEQMLPAILFELPSRHDGPWQTRVVPNKYPAMIPADGVGPTHGIYRVAPNYGYHHVIVETPFHNRDLPLMRNWEVEAIIETCVRRCAGPPSGARAARKHEP